MQRVGQSCGLASNCDSDMALELGGTAMSEGSVLCKSAPSEVGS